MKTIAVIGTGRMGTGLAHLLSKGPEAVLWATRDPHQVVERKLPWVNKVTLCAYKDALQADIIIPALWYSDLMEWIPEMSDALAGKILIDITNPFNTAFDDLLLDCSTSAAEEIQRALPRTFVVGCFKNTFWSVLESSTTQEPVSDVFVTSNDPQPKAQLLQLFQGLPFRFLDAGPLRNNRTIERMTVLARELGIRYGYYPRISYRLWV